MAKTLVQHVSKKNIPQSEPLDSKQIKNNAGGYGYEANMWDILDRFLILGVEGGTFYVDEKPLTKQNYQNLEKCINADGVRVVKRIVEISLAGLNIRQKPLLFALAACASDKNLQTRQEALNALSLVCRTSTMLFSFLNELKGFRGLGGRAIKRALQNWYTEKQDDSLLLQLLKYRNREGWSHADVIKISHPKTFSNVKNALFKWTIDGSWDNKKASKPAQLKAFELIQNAKVEDACNLISGYKLSMEMVPNAMLSEKRVWEALLDNLLYTATIRNLGNMSKNGLFDNFSDNIEKVVQKIVDPEAIRLSRVHPMAILTALGTYSMGKGNLGSGTWSVNQKIVNALDKAFYASFGNHTPTNKRIVNMIDISGSMCFSYHKVANFTPAQLAVAMAMIITAQEDRVMNLGFNTTTKELSIDPRRRMDDIVKDILSNGGTDCASPIRYCLDNKIVVDAMIMYTDSETWAGRQHVQVVFDEYKRRVNPNVKMVVVSMVANQHTVAPSDKDVLQVVGFNPQVPQVISSFIG